MMLRFVYPDGYVWNPEKPLEHVFKGHFLIYVRLSSPSTTSLADRDSLPVPAAYLARA